MAGWRADRARKWLKSVGLRPRYYHVKMIKLGMVIMLTPRVDKGKKGYWEKRYNELMAEAANTLYRLDNRGTMTFQPHAIYIGVPHWKKEEDMPTY